MGMCMCVGYNCKPILSLFKIKRGAWEVKENTEVLEVSQLDSLECDFNKERLVYIHDFYKSDQWLLNMCVVLYNAPTQGAGASSF